MTRSCRITPRASQDIEAIADYLATHSSLTRAKDFLSGTDAVFQRIAQFPGVGRNVTNSILVCAVCPTSSI